MGNIENEFGRHLDEALANRQTETAQTIDAEKTRQRLAQMIPHPQVILKKVEELAEEARDKGVLQLESTLPIRSYLETLKSKISPNEKLTLWGPWKGQIAYSFAYDREKNKKIHVVDKVVEKETTVRAIIRGQSRGHGFTLEQNERRTIYPKTPIYKYVDVATILCVVLDSTGNVRVGTKNLLEVPSQYEGLFKGRLGRSLDHLEELAKEWHRNISFNLADEYRSYTRIPNPIFWPQREVGIDINTPEGMKQFTQALTDFYVGLKTGQIK